MSENPDESRLPPPAFPPGQRRYPHRNSRPTQAQAPHLADGEDPMIDPDDPIPPRRDAVDQALISPDEPIPDRGSEPLLEGDDGGRLDAQGEGEGQVVGMDLDPHMSPLELRATFDPHVAELAGAVVRLADGLERRGEAALRTTPDMSRFEATLRAYCVGYLVDRRVREPLTPIVRRSDHLASDG